MTKSQRSLNIRHRRFFWLVVIGLLVFLGSDAYFRHAYIARSTHVKTNEVANEASLPISPEARFRNLVLPLSAIDGKWWMLHTDAMLRSGDWRVRSTQLDNSPDGREMQWSSALVWLLALLTRVVQGQTGWTIIQSMEFAVTFLAPLLLVTMLAVLTRLTVKHLGWIPAAGHLLMLATSFSFFELFRLGEHDHHGLVAFFSILGVLGLILGILKKAPSTSSWFAFSGWAGAAALWVSSATQIPVLVGCGLGAVLIALITRKENDVAVFPWRIWGFYGCIGSLSFYLLENFPSNLGWRLEVNHPLYALAWLGGGDILERITRKISGGRFAEVGSGDWLRIVGSLLALLAPALCIFIFPEKVFWVADRFVFLLHKTYINEFKSILAVMQDEAARKIAIIFLLWPTLLLSLSARLLSRATVSMNHKMALVLTLAPATVMLVLAMTQVRWSGMATCLWSLVLLVIVTINQQSENKNALPPWMRRSFGSLAFLLCLFQPIASALGAYFTFADRQAKSDFVATDMVPSILARDVAHRLIEYRPDQLPVILSGPTTSSELAYFGGCKVIGTLYWENMPGLKKAAHMFGATAETDLFTRLQQNGVTHIVVFSWDDFADRYLSLLALAESRPKPSSSLLANILHGKTPPTQWLRQLPYQIPPSFNMPKEWVHIYEVRPDQTKSDWLYFRGLAYAEEKKLADSATMFAQMITIDPADARALSAYLSVAVASPAPPDLSVIPLSIRDKIEKEISLRKTK